jgi:hypothetical protein
LACIIRETQQLSPLLHTTISMHDLCASVGSFMVNLAPHDEVTILKHPRVVSDIMCILRN